MRSVLFPVNDELKLELVNHSHASELFELVNKNRESLRQWLPWVDMITTLDEEIRYIDYYRARFIKERALTATIIYCDQIAGIVSLNYVDWQTHSTAIGYWLGSNFRGRGLMLRSTKAMIDYAFETLKLHRTQIFCGVGNLPSRKIPERLGIPLEGQLRDGEWLNGAYIDLSAYGITRQAWQQLRRSSD